jgi:hypothetical protein
MSFIEKRLKAIDRWLCLHLRPWQVRWWWHRLWIRSDEFHPSLDQDSEIAVAMGLKHAKHMFDYSGSERYYEDLCCRRGVAHERTIDAVVA